MSRPLKAIRVVLTAVLLLLAGVLILQALGYGVGFVIDPETGIEAFGYESPVVVDALTVALVALAGAGMIGFAVLLALAGMLVVRANPAGTYVAMTVGGVYLLIGAIAHRAEWWWDAYFYAVTGASLIVLATAVRLLTPKRT